MSGEYDMNLLQDSINKLVDAREILQKVLDKINTIDTTENDKQKGDHVAALRKRVQMNKERLEKEKKTINSAIDALEAKRKRMNRT